MRVVKLTLVGIILALLGFSLSSCSSLSKIMLPYHEKFECQRSTDYGYCGPVSKVYKESVIISKKGGEQ